MCRFLFNVAGSQSGTNKRLTEIAVVMAILFYFLTHEENFAFSSHTSRSGKAHAFDHKFWSFKEVEFIIASPLLGMPWIFEVRSKIPDDWEFK